MIKLPTKKRVDLYKNAVSSEQLQLDLAAAQEFMFDAWETDDLEIVLKLIRKAIKKSPLCADAYSFYCEISEETPESKIGTLETALYAASVALGEDFREFAGNFWGFVETCPNMRAKAALADALWESGNFSPAMAHCREMLKLNPNDHQGIRHLLTKYYLELEMVDDLTLLLDDYSGDMRPFLQYTRALLAYRQSSPDADDIAKAAISSNRHIPDLLSNCKLQPKSNSEYITLGGMDEAIYYVNNNLKP
ncbi:tetratricopeptide repeat protein [Enterobacter sp. WCHEn045836]|uniref:tetratricopeptide repeat protein n=1 Tax=Enterobacter sp. WCHEn045836 TaxID=2497434 RepID=UPI000F8375DC|nr:tetratricopeptide repeat protein [Enterobacter sp. WCHEn045836]RTQ00604.1 tetratricopeptide repeat protein [Enterobacter sp. WCHEn045836]